MNREDEEKVREIIKKSIDKEFKDFKAIVDKEIKDSVRDNDKKLESNVSTSIKKEIDSLEKKYLTKKDVKELMAKAFSRQHKFMWEKSNFITSYFNDL